MNQKYYIVVTPFFPTKECFRGSYIYDQVKAIERNSSYQLIVFVPCKNSNRKKSYKYNEITVHLFPVRNTPSFLFNGIFNSYNAHSFLKAFSALGIEGNNVDYIHCHTSSFGAIGIALKKKFPHVTVLLQHHCRDPYTILNGKLSSWYPNLWFRAWKNINIFSKVDIHVNISKITEQNLRCFPQAAENEDYSPYLQKLFKLTKMKTPIIKRSLVLYNGVDTHKFYPIQKAPSNLFKIGCIANFISLKDQITLIKATELLVNRYKIKNIKVEFIGSGPTLAACKAYVTSHELTDFVSFIKERDHSELCSFYNTLNLFVLPSVYEGFGCVFTEAYACGVPFILCENQGATEYIPTDEYSKWVFKKHDYKTLAERINAFARNKYNQELKYPFDIDELIRNFIIDIHNELSYE